MAVKRRQTHYDHVANWISRVRLTLGRFSYCCFRYPLYIPHHAIQSRLYNLTPTKVSCSSRIVPYQLTFPRGSIPDPPGYLPPKSAKELSKVCLPSLTFLYHRPNLQAQPPTQDVILKQHRQSTDLKMRRAWDLALSYVPPTPALSRC